MPTLRTKKWGIRLLWRICALSHAMGRPRCAWLKEWSPVGSVAGDDAAPPASPLAGTLKWRRLHKAPWRWPTKLCLGAVIDGRERLSSKVTRTTSGGVFFWSPTCKNPFCRLIPPWFPRIHALTLCLPLLTLSKPSVQSCIPFESARKCGMRRYFTLSWAHKPQRNKNTAVVNPLQCWWRFLESHSFAIYYRFCHLVSTKIKNTRLTRLFPNLSHIVLRQNLWPNWLSACRGRGQHARANGSQTLFLVSIDPYATWNAPQPPNYR